jgi:ribonuclease HI
MSVTTPLKMATDGSSLGNPGPGGWCYYIDEERWGSGGIHLPVTNNQMELSAVYYGLVHVGVEDVVLEVDSQYAINALTKWHHGWRRNGWTNKAGQPVANRELIESVLELLSVRKSAGCVAEFQWVRGHNGFLRNEIADRRARYAANEAKSTKAPYSGKQ